MPQSKTAAGQPLDVTGVIDRAKGLLKAQRETQKAITENRQLLRLLDSNQMLDEAQGAWLDAFYPEKKKGERRSDDAVKRTKEVRAEALGISVDDVGDDDE